MDDWGRDPDVALFVGGPKHGQFEAIGSTNTYYVREPIDVVYSFYDTWATPKTIYSRGTQYIRGQAMMPDGSTVTVMRDQSWNMREVTLIAEGEWKFRQVWYNPPQYAVMGGWLPPRTRKSQEEAIAWVHNGKGKDFL